MQCELQHEDKPFEKRLLGVCLKHLLQSQPKILLYLHALQQLTVQLVYGCHSCLLQSLRETCNVAKYEHIMDKIAGRLGPAYMLDR